MAGTIIMAGTLAVASQSTAGARGLNGPALTKWQGAMANLRLPGEGCFTASYPALTWRVTHCQVAPRVPFAPAVQNPATPVTPPTAKPVGDGNDYSAVVTGPISEATGSFTNVSPGITEKGQFNGSGPKHPNTFSLQLNTQFFSGSPTCSGSSKPSKCLAWQQFVYDTRSNTVFMQYWLINYGATCPSHWFSYQSDCFTNSPATTFSGGAITAPELATTKLSGSANPGSTDTIELSNGSQVSSVNNPDSVLDLAASWNTTEFGVFGDAGGGQAKFGKKSTLETLTTITSNSLAAPECVQEGFTGETNNLVLTGTPALGTVVMPTMGSEQTNGTKKAASCASAPG